MNISFKLLILVLFSQFCVAAQGNLVHNPSFENFDTCSDLFTTLNHDNRVKYWLSPTSATPDYFTDNCGPSFDNGFPSNLGGFQYPHTGTSYTGVFAWTQALDYTFPTYREYIEGTLTEPLKAGKTYEVSFWISLSIVSLNYPQYSYSARNMGAYFSKTKIFEFNKIDNFQVAPQIETDTMITDTSSWVKVCGRFTAEGGERYIIIGNFRDDQHTELQLIDHAPNGLFHRMAYFYIDDVSVVETNSPRLLPRDTFLCADDYPFLIASGVQADAYRWSTGQTDASIYASQEGDYFLRAESNECLIYDTIHLKTPPEPQSTFADVSVCMSKLPLVIKAPSYLDSWHWPDGSSNQQYNVTSEGWQLLEGNWYCGNFADSMYVTVEEPLIFQLPSAPPSCQSGQFVPFLYDPALQLPTYQWSTGDTTSTTVLPAPGVYTLASTNSCGAFQDTLNIQDCEPAIYIPNIIAPNSGGINAWFIPFGQNIHIDRLRIVNHFGQIMYDERSPQKGWDGTTDGRQCQNGVYVYILEYTELDKNERVLKIGDVTLVR